MSQNPSCIHFKIVRFYWFIRQSLLFKILKLIIHFLWSVSKCEPIFSQIRSENFTKTTSKYYHDFAILFSYDLKALATSSVLVFLSPSSTRQRLCQLCHTFTVCKLCTGQFPLNILHEKMLPIPEISNLKISSLTLRVTSRLLTLACPSMWSTKPRAYAGPRSMWPRRSSSMLSQGNIGPSSNSAFMNLIKMYLAFHIPACAQFDASLLSCESPSLLHKNYLAWTPDTGCPQKWIKNGPILCHVQETNLETPTSHDS